MTNSLNPIAAGAMIALWSAANIAAPAFAGTAQATAAQSTPKAMTRWAKAIARTLRHEMRTPKRFETAQEYGAASYDLTVNQAGEVLSAKQTQSAGFARLDESAADTIARMKSLPPMPAGITAQRAVVHMQLAYLPMPTSSVRQTKRRHSKTDTIDLGQTKSGIQISLRSDGPAASR